MAMDKKDIALTVGGILAGLTLTYLLYRLERSNAAHAQLNATNDAALQQSQLSNEQQQIASLPNISVPTISATPSGTDTTQQATNPANDLNLASIISAFQSQDNSGVTSQQSNHGLVIPTLNIPTTVQKAYGLPAQPTTTLSETPVAYSNPVAPIAIASQATPISTASNNSSIYSGPSREDAFNAMRTTSQSVN